MDGCRKACLDTPGAKTKGCRAQSGADDSFLIMF
jgi:hypothetical protein